jgi:hypothetical protein
MTGFGCEQFDLMTRRLGSDELLLAEELRAWVLSLRAMRAAMANGQQDAATTGIPAALCFTQEALRRFDPARACVRFTAPDTAAAQAERSRARTRLTGRRP